MKSLYVLLLILAAFTVPVYGQGAGGAQTVPLTEGFESSFITGHNVEFIDGWQASISNEDTLWQETVNVHSGAGALAAIPFGEEESAVDILVETTLNLNGKSNASCTFWAASEETGGDKSVLLFLTTSIDGGTTWSPLVQIGDGETFPNANTPYSQYLYALHPSTNNQSNVILRFVIRSGERRTPIAKLLIDDVYITDNAADTFKPYVLAPTLLAPDSIRLVFSEPVGTGATVTTNYTLTPSISVNAASLTATQDTVHLKLAAALEANVVYKLAVGGIADLAGNVMDPYEAEITYHVPLPGLVVTEIFYDNPPPEMNDQLEFIELYNATTKPISLEGLQIKEAIFSGPFPAYSLQPGEYWVLTFNNEVFESVFGFSANYDWMASNLANEGDYVALYPAVEHAPYTLDSVRYGISAPWPAEGAGTGSSIELTNAFLDNSLGSNWVAATEAAGTLDGYMIRATPGKARTGAAGPSVNLGQDGNRCGITELSLDAGNPGSKYLWSTGEETQTILATESGEYWVLVNNGIGVDRDTITVEFVPAVVAAADFSSSACAVTDIQFTDASEGAISWQWTFGDGSSSNDQHPKHQYGEPGQYQVKLVVANAYGCTDTLEAPIQVNINALSFTFPELLCENTEAGFSDSSPSATQWSWNFGDDNAASEQQVKHTYAHAGTYRVQLTVQNEYGCTRSVEQDVVVNPNKAGFALEEKFCAHTEASFGDNSTSGASWAWSFGDGGTSTDQHAKHTYGEPGQYMVQLTVMNTYGCESKVTETVTVNPNEVAMELPEGPFCTWTPLSFNGTADSGESWSWEFGDGNTGNVQQHQHQYTQDGEFQVRLTVQNAYGCTNTAAQSIAVGICVGVDDQMREEQITLYPNPSNGTFSVALDWTGKGPAEIRMMNAAGKTVFARQLVQTPDNVYTFDVRELPEGLYLVKIKADRGIVSRKLLVKK